MQHWGYFALSDCNVEREKLFKQASIHNGNDLREIHGLLIVDLSMMCFFFCVSPHRTYLLVRGYGGYALWPIPNRF